MAEPGLLLAAGQPALTMAFADRLYVRTFVPETKLGRVRTGQSAAVSVDAFPGKSFPARVAEISPDAEFTPKAVETRERARQPRVLDQGRPRPAAGRSRSSPASRADVAVDTESGPR